MGKHSFWKLILIPFHQSIFCIFIWSCFQLLTNEAREYDMNLNESRNLNKNKNPLKM